MASQVEVHLILTSGSLANIVRIGFKIRFLHSPTGTVLDANLTEGPGNAAPMLQRVRPGTSARSAAQRIPSRLVCCWANEP
jgi:hypothetical protein